MNKNILIFDKDIIEEIDKKNFSISSFKKIWNFIEKEPFNFIKTNSTDLSKKLDISQSTVSRFATKIGFASFKDLQIYVSQRIQYKKDLEIDIKDENNLTLTQVMNNIKSHYLFSLESTLTNLNLEKNITDYINTLLKYRKMTIFFGVGESALVAKYLATNLRKIGFNTIFINDIHEFFSFSNLLKDHMHITLISKSCKTLEIKQIKEYLDKFSIATSIWTKNSKITVTKNVQNVIFLDSIEQNYRIGSIGSKISAFIIADIIFTYLSSKIDHKQTIFAKIENNIDQWNNLNIKDKK
ncbi:MurR/RpiR family transcriptional regulator [Mycoplasma sp. 1012]